MASLKYVSVETVCTELEYVKHACVLCASVLVYVCVCVHACMRCMCVYECVIYMCACVCLCWVYFVLSFRCVGV